MLTASLTALALALSAPAPAAAQAAPSPTYSPPPASSGTVASPSSSPNAQWSTLLGNTLWFYDAQRSGRLSAGAYGNRVEWRNDSALQDGADYNVDLTGGWYDAGDYIKATFPLGYTLFSLAWGALSYGPGYDAAHQTAYLDGTLRWGYDWLMRAHPSDDVLFVQVGGNEADLAYWGGDGNIPQPRQAFPVNASHPGTDAWASTAAAFALGALAYSGSVWNTSGSVAPASLANGTYADLLRQHAESLYKTAKGTTPLATYSQSVPQIKAAYSSSGYGDDLAIAALALAAATNSSDYYHDAYNYYQQYALSGKRQVWNWDSRSPAVFVLFAEVANARPGIAQAAGLATNLTGWQAEAEAYLDSIVDGKQGYLTKGGLLFYPGDSDEASLNPAVAAATLMLRYAPLASSPAKAAAYNSFAKGQIDYLLGDNPMARVYVVGQHPNSPQNPHSALAAGGNNINNIRNDPPTEAYVLYGAMPGGPLKSDKFWDYRDDWVQTEIALDYNSNLPSIAAFQIVNGSADPFYVGLQAGSYTTPGGQPCDAALPCGSSLSAGAKAGIAVGVILGVAIIVAALVYWQRDRVARWRRGYRGPGK
ncbi:hypothetical protein Q8F55_002797 [Vanrija albida]|uniref:Endoglucanase n=1 Tax=Vanrija albida TaxID=181172 RepID=A0ABR3QAU3_9TREE